jgi:putative membrane protein
MVIPPTPETESRIAGALAAARVRTSGEIFCVIADEVSPYRDLSLGWATAAALLSPLALIPFGFDPAWIPGLGDGWQAAHLAALDVIVGESLAASALIQSAVFVTVFLLATIPAVRRVLTPRSVRRARVRRAAVAQFLAHGVQLSPDRAGVLIFAAVSDRQAEIVADGDTHARIDPGVWADAARALADGMKTGDPAAGFVAAIDLCAAALAEPFPPRRRRADTAAGRLVRL